MNYTVDLTEYPTIGGVLLLLGYGMLLFFVTAIVVHSWLFWNPITLVTVRGVLVACTLILVGAYTNKKKEVNYDN